MAKKKIVNDRKTSHELAEMIAELALEKKAEDIVVLDVSKQAGFTDYFVIATGNSDVHLKTLCDYIEDELSQYKVKVWHKEGYENLKWILMDYVDVVAHIFDSETREYYDLETLWADAEKIIVRDE
ncbi:MAG: ribosome silencing factor [Candidatus Marinimicrobia bacterium]|nr:ribosome silencing factor [Candidatus Neomarinimicrobiota bacterium]